VLLRYGGRVNEAVDAYAEAIAVFKAVGARRAEARVKNALAYAMFVMERFEDAIAVGMSSIAIDLRRFTSGFSSAPVFTLTNLLGGTAAQSFHNYSGHAAPASSGAACSFLRLGELRARREVIT